MKERQKEIQRGKQRFRERERGRKKAERVLLLSSSQENTKYIYITFSCSLFFFKNKKKDLSNPLSTQMERYYVDVCIFLSWFPFTCLLLALFWLTFVLFLREKKKGKYLAD